LWFRILLLLLLASLPQGCARKDPAVDSLIGSEPQRLSFGPPPEVLQSFVQKMKLCWLSGPGSALGAYRYETGEHEDDQTGDAYPTVRLFDTGGVAIVFEIQFHKYNDNTLIVTRNFSMPPDLLIKVKRDIQLWALAGRDCTS
jgi:hypothetical protein